MAHPKNDVRVCEAYMTMAKQARYRPGAPSDGFGNTCLSEQQLSDPDILKEEAGLYAIRFLKQEDTAQFWIGVSDYSTNRALVYVIEAARCLCSGWAQTREVRSQMLLRLAIDELQDIHQASAEDNPNAPRSDDSH